MDLPVSASGGPPRTNPWGENVGESGNDHIAGESSSISGISKCDIHTLTIRGINDIYEQVRAELPSDSLGVALRRSVPKLPTECREAAVAAVQAYQKRRTDENKWRAYKETKAKAEATLSTPASPPRNMESKRPTEPTPTSTLNPLMVAGQVMGTSTDTAPYIFEELSAADMSALDPATKQRIRPLPELRGKVVIRKKSETTGVSTITNPRGLATRIDTTGSAPDTVTIPIVIDSDGVPEVTEVRPTTPRPLLSAPGDAEEEQWQAQRRSGWCRSSWSRRRDFWNHHVDRAHRGGRSRAGSRAKERRRERE